MFRVGDLVRLKSGGPVMTVSFVNGNHDVINCAWFDGTEKKETSFNIASLQKADNDPTTGVLIDRG